MNLTREKLELARTVLTALWELPAELRPARLEDLCGGDAELHEWVDAALRDTDLLDRRFGGAIERTLSLLRDVDRLDVTSIAGFPVGAKLGRGGFGTVFLAEQERPRRKVAIKVLRSFLMTPRLLAQFEREADLCGALDHSGIAQVHGAGKGLLRASDDSVRTVAFMVMQYIDGKPLLDHAAAARLTLRQRLELFGSICDAVAYAHQRGVIHCDLKPGNILVTAEGPKVVDFGIARAATAAIDDPAAESEPLAGTLPYMSPEQTRADRRYIDTRSDVYSLAVVLFELLTGRRPIEFKSSGLAENLAAIRTQQPERIGAVDRRFRGELEAILSKALEKEPDRRYASVAEMADDVRRYLSGRAIQAKRDLNYRIRKAVQRHWIPVAIALSVLALITNFWVMARTEAKRKSAALDFVFHVLESPDPYLAGGIDTPVRSVIAGAYDEADAWFAGDVKTARNIKLKLITVQNNQHAFADAEPRAAALRREFEESGHVREADYAAIVTLHGHILHMLDRIDEAVSALESAVEIARGLSGRPPELLGACLENLGNARIDAGDYIEAQAMLKEARKAYQAETIACEPIARIDLSLARIAELSRASEAPELMTSAVEALQACVGEDHPMTLNALEQLAIQLRDAGDYVQAEKYIKRTASGVARKFGSRSPTLGYVLRDLATVQRALMRLEESVDNASEALAIFCESGTALDCAAGLSTLGLSKLGAGQVVQAIEHQREALRLRRANREKGHWEIAESVRNLAAALMQHGDFAEADELLRASIADQEAVGNGETVATHATRLFRAECRFALGDLVGADALARQCRSVFQAHGRKELADRALAVMFDSAKVNSPSASSELALPASPRR